jgi:hypothetical protein
MLTQAEKVAGRLFRDAQRDALAKLNKEDPPGILAQVFWHVVRHECSARNGISTGITLREVRAGSPDYWICYCSVVGEAAPDFPHRDCQGGRVAAPGGLFAFTWKEGKCSGCGRTVRSRDGRFEVTDRSS